MEPPIIYNLFPRLAGRMDAWQKHAERARSMGFNWIFLNPVSQPGFSGSLYSVRDHDRVAQDFLPAGTRGDGRSALQRTLAGFRKLGLKPMMDLVINHTAIDSPLVAAHPDWFCRDATGAVIHPSAIDPADARRVTVWGDLAEVDNEASADRQGLWSFWRDLVTDSLKLGFAGFRCDAAYKVPAALWHELISAARAQDSEVQFFAETLGCRLEEVAGLEAAGMDFLFNSSKYWNFDAPWAIEQHTSFGTVAPSVSFPESHDTDRLMAETGGLLAVQRQRYLLAAVFSAGLLMPMGYEFACRRRMHVVESKAEHFQTDGGQDLRSFIGAVNRLKLELPVLQTEGQLRALWGYDQPTLVIERAVAERRALILINKDWHAPQSLRLDHLDLPAGSRFIRVAADGYVSRAEAPGALLLDPAEIALIA